MAFEELGRGRDALRTRQLHDVIGVMVTRIRETDWGGLVVRVAMAVVKVRFGPMLKHDVEMVTLRTDRKTMRAVSESLERERPSDLAANERTEQCDDDERREAAHLRAHIVGCVAGQLEGDEHTPSVMPMMDVRDVGMLVLERRVLVLMRMRLSRRVVSPVRVPVMFIVYVTMVVLHRLMGV